MKRDTLRLLRAIGRGMQREQRQRQEAERAELRAKQETERAKLLRRQARETSGQGNGCGCGAAVVIGVLLIGGLALLSI